MRSARHIELLLAELRLPAVKQVRCTSSIVLRDGYGYGQSGNRNSTNRAITATAAKTSTPVPTISHSSLVIAAGFVVNRYGE